MATDNPILERKLKAFFSLLDSDKNGVLKWNDILRPAERARQELGWTKEDTRFVKLVQELRAGWDRVLQVQDLDHNGSISYDEYVRFVFRMGLEWTANGALPAWAVELSNNFQRALDLNSDGTYTANEYAIYLRAIGSDADAKSAFAKLDLNKNGKLTYDEVLVLAKQYATSTDPSAPGNYLLTGKY
ncbi:EF-hand domain-containing protein [Archangium lipolyticum]|uniref:EF-hand domain-containing protein n=1 Tax=Archangium lipolyticum TaxID=2970465 RepID=UPI00214A64FE|nr:EF-hand domain-containing protein [Archangium lipolyticum]